MKPRLYFSFRSPYSWLTVHRLRAEVPDAFDRIEWYPYWDPDPETERAITARDAEIHYVQMSRAKHLYLLMDTKRLADGLGLPMAWPVDIDPWWERPHLAFLVAQEQGRAAAFYDAISAARWNRGENICTADVVERAAKEAGVDPDAAVRAPEDPAVREVGAACLVKAYEDDVFGIPYLRWRRHRFWGYDRLGDFLRTWRTDPSGPPPAQLDAEGEPYDTDTAGGCG